MYIYLPSINLAAAEDLSKYVETFPFFSTPLFDTQWMF